MKEVGVRGVVMLYIVFEQVCMEYRVVGVDCYLFIPPKYIPQQILQNVTRNSPVAYPLYLHTRMYVVRILRTQAEFLCHPPVMHLS